jgi:hypothetical protein
VEVTPEQVRVKTRRLRQFLAIRRMHLAVFFDFIVFAEVPIGDVPESEREVRHNDDAYRYSLHVDNGVLTGRVFSRLLGKKLIAPLPVEQSGTWPYEVEETKFADFIVGIDKDGKNVLSTCDPEFLDNFFGKNPGAPNYLTPVVFRRDVLKKYYDHPEKYTVSDGYLSCGHLWGLRIDNQAEDRVVVFLGDLGKTLAFEEQTYWKSFNSSPDGGGKDLSDVTFRRSFMGQFAESTSPELLFKNRFASFNEQWEERFGWRLIRRLQDEDAHVLKRLRVPLTSSMAEFEDQLLCLTKLLVDSLNDADMSKVLPTSIPEEKSISKFERFLSAKGYPEAQRDVALLRLLQEARSSAFAHTKGEKYKKVSVKLGLDSRPAAEVFSELLKRGVLMLESLRTFFLPPRET